MRETRQDSRWKVNRWEPIRECGGDEGDSK